MSEPFDFDASVARWRQQIGEWGPPQGPREPPTLPPFQTPVVQPPLTSPQGQYGWITPGGVMGGGVVLPPQAADVENPWWLPVDSTPPRSPWSPPADPSWPGATEGLWYKLTGEPTPDWIMRGREYVDFLSHQAKERLGQAWDSPATRYKTRLPIGPPEPSVGEQYWAKAQELEGQPWQEQLPGALGAAAELLSAGGRQAEDWWREFVEGKAPGLAQQSYQFQEQVPEIPALHGLNQLTSAGLQAISELGVIPQALYGGAVVGAHPEAQEMGVEEWAPLASIGASVGWEQFKERDIFKPGGGILDRESVVGDALREIKAGRDPYEVAYEHQDPIVQLVVEAATDPLNIFDWWSVANKLQTGKALTRAELRMATAVDEAPEMMNLLGRWQDEVGTLTRQGADALETAARATGETGQPGFWQKLKGLDPFELTPAAKAERDTGEMWIVLSGPLSDARSGDEAVDLLARWADDPESLAASYGELTRSMPGRKTGTILGSIIDDAAQLPSAKAPAGEFNPARFVVELEELALGQLKEAYGYKEPNRYLRFANAWKGLMSEFYLSAAFAPGYVARNTAGDLFTSAVDGLTSFERMDDVDDYLDVLGPITTRRITTGGEGAREALTGIKEGKSRLPGVFGRFSEWSQNITRQGEIGRLPIGEEPRYKRSYYAGLKQFFDENVLRRTPPPPPQAFAMYGPEVDSLLHEVAQGMNIKDKRAAVERFLTANSPGQALSPYRYLDAVAMDAFSPSLARQVRQGMDALPPEAGPADIQALFNRLRGLIDEDEAIRLADAESLPVRRTASDTEAEEIVEAVVEELGEIARRSGDPDLIARADDLARRAPEIEAAVVEARGAAVDVSKAQPTDDALEIMLAAYEDTNKLLSDTRARLGQRMAEVRSAYQQNPAAGNRLWPPYFDEVAHGWEDSAMARIDRFVESQQQLQRLQGGEPVESILGRTRQQRAEDRLLAASKAIPEAPEGYMPGSVMDAEESAKFDQYLANQRGRQDNARVRAWRAGFGSEPEQYGDVLDLLDSAASDVELYGKRAAGKVARARRTAFDQAAAIKARGGKNWGARVKLVFEKYYAIRNDTYREFFDAAEQRWKIAERDVMMQSYQPGPRMEPPLPEQPEAIRPRAGDKDLVRQAMTKQPVARTPEELAAIDRWTATKRALPGPVAEQAPLTIPESYTREQFSQDLRDVFKLDDAEANAVQAITDARAKVWASQTGRHPSEWYTQRLGGMFPAGEGQLSQALYQDAPRWYYKAEQVVDAKMPNQAPVDQVRAILTKGGVKKDELEWSGVLDWLAKKKGKVSKQEVMGFLQENQVRVEEVVKGKMPEMDLSQRWQHHEGYGDQLTLDGTPADEVWMLEPPEGVRDDYTLTLDLDERDAQYIDGQWRVRKYSDDWVLRQNGNPIAGGGLEEMKARAEDLLAGDLEYMPGEPGGLPKFDQYTLPGGERYRELLLTLPGPGQKTTPKGINLRQTASGQVQITGPEGQMFGFGSTVDDAVRDALGVVPEYFHDDIRSFAGQKIDKPDFQSTHWDEPNVLAHVRFNERRADDGARVLFIEEIQSDWHQAGRERGYTGERQKILDQLAGQGISKEEGSTYGFLNEEGKYVAHPNSNMYPHRAIEGTPEQGKLIRRYFALDTAVPSAPFAKSWDELTLKRMLAWAAENDFERIAWTTGAQQADRYDLAKVVDRLEWNPATNNLIGYKNGEQVITKVAGPADLPELVGKDMAARLQGIDSIDKSRLQRISPSAGEDWVEAWKGPHGNVQLGQLRDGPSRLYISGQGVQEFDTLDEAWEAAAGHLPRALEGPDLQVGGQGMKTFYDRILPYSMRKVGKKYGLQVGETYISPGDAIPLKNELFYSDDGMQALGWDGRRNKWTVIEKRTAGVGWDQAFTVAESDDMMDLAREWDIKLRGTGGEGVHSVDLTPRARQQLLTEGQPLFQAKKGAVQFMDDGRAVISAFEQADVSTVVHEVGHVFRRELEGQELADIERWAGADGGNWTREAEEKWARGFERYLAEGAAPTPELATVFERFKDWLVNIYRAIRGSDIDVALNDNVRGVFDRLLAEAPEPRAGDVFGQEMAMQRQMRAGEAQRGAALRLPMSLDDAAELYKTGDDWQVLGKALESDYQKAAQRSTVQDLRALADQMAHQRLDSPKYIEVGGKSIEITRERTMTAKKQDDLYWELQGIEPGATRGEKVKQGKAYREKQADLVDWYLDLMGDAEARAAGQQTPVRTPPEWLARESLDALEQADQLFQQGRRKPPPGQMGMFEAGEDTPLFSGAAQRAEMPDFAPATEGRREYLPGMEPTYDELAEAQAARKAKDIEELRPRKVPEGQRTLWQEAPQEESEAFKAWFGDSKVRDSWGPRVVYHGTPKEFQEFDIGRTTPESWMGAGHYFTDDIDDVNVNYGGMGTDLTNKVENLSERIAQDFYNDPYDYLDELAEVRGTTRESLEALDDTGSLEITDDEAKAIAQMQLTEHGGAVMPAYLRMERPVEVDQYGGTTFSLEYRADVDEVAYEIGYRFEDDPHLFTDELARIRGADPYDLDELADAGELTITDDEARALAETGMFDGEFGGYDQDLVLIDDTGREMDWADAVYQAARETGADSERVMGELMEELGSDFYGVTAHELRETILRLPGIQYLEGEWGPGLEYTLLGHQFVAELFKNLDYDGIIMDAGQAFPRMDYTEGVKHYIVWESGQIKSAIGNRGTFDLDDPNVLHQTNNAKRAAYNAEVTQKGAGEAPAYADMVQASAQATRQGLDQIEAGVLRDWDTWQPRVADEGTRQAMMDWLDNEVSPAWYDTRAVGLDYAKARADEALLNYRNRRNFDMWLSYVVPYSYWFTRSGWNWAKRLATKPALLSNYVRARDAMKLANEQSGRRQRFEERLAIPFPWLPDWMGDNIYVDPLKFVLPFATFGGTNWDDADESRTALQSINSTIQTLGLRPYHFLEYPLKMALAKEKGMPADFGYFLPHTRLLQGLTAGTELGGPGGVNLEAIPRKALGLPTGETWDPYRAGRMVGNLAAEDPTNQQLARAALIAMELLKRDPMQREKLWEPGNPLAQMVAAEMNWQPVEMQAAQDLLAKAMTRAAQERLVGTLGSFAGPGAAVESRGERAQLEMAELGRKQIYGPDQQLGGREAYQAYKDRYPAMYPRSAQYTLLPGEEPGNTMTPGARANWLALRTEKARINAQYDAQVDAHLRARPWDWKGKKSLETQRYQELDRAKARYPVPEMTGDLPAILYGMNPAEMWDSVIEDALWDVKAEEPDPDAFTDAGGEVDWGAYYDARDGWLATLPADIPGVGQVQGGAYSGMTTAEALHNFDARHYSPLEAANRVYQEMMASPAWDAYNASKAAGKKDWSGTVGAVGPVGADQLIPEILRQYAARGWTEQELAQALAGVVFPPLEDQMDDEGTASIYTQAKDRFGADILDLQEQYFTHAKGSQARRDFLDQHPQLGQYWDWKRAKEGKSATYLDDAEQELLAAGDWRAALGKPWWEKYPAKPYSRGPSRWLPARRRRKKTSSYTPGGYDYMRPPGQVEGAGSMEQQAKTEYRQMMEIIEQQWPGIDEMEQAYFGLEPGERRQFLDQYPELRDYWDFKDQWWAEHPVGAEFYGKGQDIPGTGQVMDGAGGGFDYLFPPTSGTGRGFAPTQPARWEPRRTMAGGPQWAY